MMNLATLIVSVAVLAALGIAIRKTIRRKGRCACCDGTCPGCNVKKKEALKK